MPVDPNELVLSPRAGGTFEVRFGGESLALLEKLADRHGIDARSALVNALWLYNWASDVVQSGQRIAKVDPLTNGIALVEFDAGLSVRQGTLPYG